MTRDEEHRLGVLLAEEGYCLSADELSRLMEATEENLGSFPSSKQARELWLRSVRATLAMLESQRAEAGEPPADWHLHSRRVMEAYAGERHALLAAFGLERPINWAKIAPLLEQMAEADSSSIARGDEVRLAYPALGRFAESGVVQRVTREIMVRPTYTPEQREAAGVRLAAEGVFVPLPEGPLYRLARVSADIASEVGISQAEAVSFLLAAEDVTLPWIEPSTVYRARTGTTEVLLRIGTTEVRPEEVRAAYEKVRSRPFSWSGHVDDGTASAAQRFADSNPLRYGRKRTQPKTARAVAFVDAFKAERRLQSMTHDLWDECNGLFAAANDGDGYKDGEALRTTYARADARAKGAAR